MLDQVTSSSYSSAGVSAANFAASGNKLAQDAIDSDASKDAGSTNNDAKADAKSEFDQHFDRVTSQQSGVAAADKNSKSTSGDQSQSDADAQAQKLVDQVIDDLQSTQQQQSADGATEEKTKLSDRISGDTVQADPSSTKKPSNDGDKNHSNLAKDGASQDSATQEMVATDSANKSNADKSSTGDNSVGKNAIEQASNAQVAAQANQNQSAGNAAKNAAQGQSVDQGAKDPSDVDTINISKESAVKEGIAKEHIAKEGTTQESAAKASSDQAKLKQESKQEQEALPNEASNDKAKSTLAAENAVAKSNNQAKAQVGPTDGVKGSANVAAAGVNDSISDKASSDNNTNTDVGDSDAVAKQRQLALQLAQRQAQAGLTSADVHRAATGTQASAQTFAQTKASDLEDIAELVAKMEQLSPAQKDELAVLKDQLKATILALPSEQRGQLQQKLNQSNATNSANTNSQANSQVNTPAKMLEQIEGALAQDTTAHNIAQSAQSLSKPALESRFNQGFNANSDTNANKDSIHAAQSAGASSSAPQGESDESSEGKVDVTLPQQESAPSKQRQLSNFATLMQQIEGTARGASGAANLPEPASHSAIVNARLDQVESQNSAVQSTSSAPKTLEQQLDKLPLDQQQAAANALKQRVSVMVNGGLKQAVIQLDPEELGAMSIRISMQQDQLSVQFQVQNPAAKEMLEQSMGKLKELLEQQGIALNQGDVQQQSQGQGDGQENSPDSELNQGIEDDFVSDVPAQTLVLHKQSADGIDYYA